MFDFLNLRDILILIHLFGVAIGAGGALTSDALFLRAARDSRIDASEYRLVHTGGLVVILGLVILFGSGLAMFSLNPQGYIADDKFLAKMSVVAIIAINGVLFHVVHLPRLAREERIRTNNRMPLLLSGVISVLSWPSAIILGALHFLPFSYFAIVGTYAVILLLGVAGAILLKNIILPIR